MDFGDSGFSGLGNFFGTGADSSGYPAPTPTTGIYDTLGGLLKSASNIGTQYLGLVGQQQLAKQNSQLQQIQNQGALDRLLQTGSALTSSPMIAVVLLVGAIAAAIFFFRK